MPEKKIETDSDGRGGRSRAGEREPTLRFVTLKWKLHSTQTYKTHSHIDTRGRAYFLGEKTLCDASKNYSLCIRYVCV